MRDWKKEKPDLLEETHHRRGSKSLREARMIEVWLQHIEDEDFDGEVMAERFGCTRSEVEHIMRKHGISMMKRHMRRRRA